MLLVQVVPFQLLIIPLYVLIVRDYGLADTYLGMILPFAINSTAVFVFRQFFLQLPRRAVRRRPHRRRQRAAHPAVGSPCRWCKPALLTAVLLTFIGPWNEFLWPFLVTKEHDMQPLAVSLANYINTVAGAGGQPVRRDPRRRLSCWPRPPSRCSSSSSGTSSSTEHRLRGEGMTC